MLPTCGINASTCAISAMVRPLLSSRGVCAVACNCSEQQWVQWVQWAAVSSSSECSIVNSEYETSECESSECEPSNRQCTVGVRGVLLISRTDRLCLLAGCVWSLTNPFCRSTDATHTLVGSAESGAAAQYD